MTAWSLGVDLGTSYTVAAAAVDGEAEVVDTESSGSSRIPSCVFLSEDGEILVGTAALHQSVFAPKRYEPTPKRLIGEGSVFLGERLVSVAELLAAILRRVYTEACRQRGERPPRAMAVTHPAGWSDIRLRVLREALEMAGMGTAMLVAEPVAAATRIASKTTQPGQRIAVYDFGGGTFDAAVLARTGDDFEVAGPPSGRDPLGGEDIDQRILVYLGELLEPDFPEEWRSLVNPPDVAWRRHTVSLRREVQRAKETLSDTGAVQLWVPGIERDVQLTRAELDKLVTSDVEATVATLQSALIDASVDAKGLAGLYLVGGSSRMPIVADTIWRRLGVRPSVQDNPKSVVALGAALIAERGRRADTGPEPGTSNGQVAPQHSPSHVTGQVAVPSGAPGAFVIASPPAPPPPSTPPASAPSWTAPTPPPGRPYRSRLRVNLDPAPSAQGFDVLSMLVLDRPASSGTPAVTIRAREDRSAFADTRALGQSAYASRAAQTPGFQDMGGAPAEVLGVGQGLERRFSMTVDGVTTAMFELYLVDAGRAFVVAGPLSVREVADHLRARPRTHSPAHIYETPWDAQLPLDFVAYEQVSVRRTGTNHALTANRWTYLPPASPEAWTQEQVGALLRTPGTSVVGQGPGAVLGIAGVISTIQWSANGTPMLTKLGTARLGDDSLSLVIALPHAEQGLFPSLAGHAMALG